VVGSGVKSEMLQNENGFSRSTMSEMELPDGLAFQSEKSPMRLELNSAMQIIENPKSENTTPHTIPKLDLGIARRQYVNPEISKKHRVITDS